MITCTNTLSDFTCSRADGHPGACKAVSGHWWAKYDSGRADKQPSAPLSADTLPTPDFRGVWV